MAAGGPFSHILVPIDGSDASIHAGRVAMRISVTHSIPITFVYVVDKSVVDRIAGTGPMRNDEVRGELEQKGQRYLDYLMNEARNQGLQVKTLTRYGMPHTEITQLARELDVDLISIGQSSRSGPRRAMIGSVAARVVEYADCPVLVVKPSSPSR